MTREMLTAAAPPPRRRRAHARAAAAEARNPHVTRMDLPEVLEPLSGTRTLEPIRSDSIEKPLSLTECVKRVTLMHVRCKSISVRCGRVDKLRNRRGSGSRPARPILA